MTCSHTLPTHQSAICPLPFIYPFLTLILQRYASPLAPQRAIANLSAVDANYGRMVQQKVAKIKATKKGTLLSLSLPLLLFLLLLLSVILLLPNNCSTSPDLTVSTSNSLTPLTHLPFRHFYLCSRPQQGLVEGRPPQPPQISAQPIQILTAATSDRSVVFGVCEVV